MDDSSDMECTMQSVSNNFMQKYSGMKDEDLLVEVPSIEY